MALDALARTLQLHKEDGAATTLQFRLPLVPLLDAAHCMAWGEELESQASQWEVRTATKDLWSSLPTAKGLYMFVWRPQFGFMRANPADRQTFGWILYIGQSGAGGSQNTLRARYKGEYSKLVAGDPSGLFNAEQVSKREDVLRRYLALQPLEFWYAEVGDVDRIGVLERQLIRTFNPPLNRQHAVLSKGTTKPAF